MSEGTLTDYPMSFARYRALKEEEKPKTEEKPAASEKKSGRPARGNREQQSARRQLTICEGGIARLEEKIAAFDAQMETYACNAEKLGELYREKSGAEAELEKEMKRWEELSLTLEE